MGRLLVLSVIGLVVIGITAHMKLSGNDNTNRVYDRNSRQLKLFSKAKGEKLTKLDLNFIETSRREFNTIANCQIYLDQQTCLSCYPGFELSFSSDQCQQGELDGCAQYLRPSICSYCIRGFKLNQQGSCVQCTDQYSDVNFHSQPSKSQIDWSKGTVPSQNTGKPSPQLQEKYKLEIQQQEQKLRKEQQLLQQLKDGEDGERKDGQSAGILKLDGERKNDLIIDLNESQFFQFLQ